jgi:hypothetical protein
MFATTVIPGSVISQIEKIHIPRIAQSIRKIIKLLLLWAVTSGICFGVVLSETFFIVIPAITPDLTTPPGLLDPFIIIPIALLCIIILLHTITTAKLLICEISLLQNDINSILDPYGLQWNLGGAPNV